MMTSSPPSAAEPAKPAGLTPQQARNAALMNQLATPGLGSLMARRWVAGTGQLVVFVAGFVLFMGWAISLLQGFYGFVDTMRTQAEPVIRWHWLWWGLVLCAVGWFWALVTSIQLLRAGKTPLPVMPTPATPPPIPK